MLKEGDKAIDFVLKDENGQEVILSSFKNKKIVIYFYPRDNTPGCTTEACSIRDIYDEILATDSVVIGISTDKQESHQKFKSKYNLPFYLLCDENHQIAEKYETWGEKTFMGKKFLGLIRKTFIIDQNFIIRKIYPKVTPKNHGPEILDFIKQM